LTGVWDRWWHRGHGLTAGSNAPRIDRIWTGPANFKCRYTILWACGSNSYIRINNAMWSESHTILGWVFIFVLTMQCQSL
jgi:hypothetical protein